MDWNWRCAGSCRVLMLLVLLSSTASAQNIAEDGPPEGAPFVRLGRFSFGPAVVVSSSYDTNVHRTAGDPIQGVEFVTVPQVDAFFGGGRMRMHGVAAVEVARYPALPDEGFVNDLEGFDFAWASPRVQPFLSVTRRNTFARPEYEIGARSDRLLLDYQGGLRFRAGARVTMRGEARRAVTDYKADAIYDNTSLQEKLNNTHDAGVFNVGYRLTPLTSITGTVEATRDRFEFSPERNATSRAAMVGVSLEGQALIRGAGMIGIRNFHPQQNRTRGYNGLVGNGSLSYGGGAFFVTAVGYQDVSFSYDTSLAYYVARTAEVITLSRFVRWSIGGLFRHDWLDYQFAGGPAGAGQTTTRLQAGASVGHDVGRFARVGVNLGYDRSKGGQQWTAWRVTTFLTYGVAGFVRLDRPTPR